MMNKSYLKDWTRDELENEIIKMDDENFHLQMNVKILEETVRRLESQKVQIKSIQLDNSELNQAVQQWIREKNVAASKKEVDNNNLLNPGYKNELEKTGLEFKSDDNIDIESIIYEFESQHQRDIITIKDLHTALDVMCDKYSGLRNMMETD